MLEKTFYEIVFNLELVNMIPAKFGWGLVLHVDIHTKNTTLN
jgi:hypothetical protein